MILMEAHSLVAAWPHDKREELLPATVTLRLRFGDCDAWPAAATAGAMLTGWLPNLETEAELEEAVRQFFRLLEGGVVDRAAWEEETRNVIRHLMAWGVGQERQARLAAAPFN